MLELAAKVNQTVGSLAGVVLLQTVVRETQSDLPFDESAKKPLDGLPKSRLMPDLRWFGKVFKPDRSASTPVGSILGERVSCRLAHAGTEH